MGARMAVGPAWRMPRAKSRASGVSWTSRLRRVHARAAVGFPSRSSWPSASSRPASARRPSLAARCHRTEVARATEAATSTTPTPTARRRRRRRVALRSMALAKASSPAVSATGLRSRHSAKSR